MTRANLAHIIATGTTGKLQLVRKPSDWRVGDRASLMRHTPTDMLFEMTTRPDLNLDHSLTMDDFSARLVHARGGVALPTDADLDVLRGEAVLMALFLVGLAWPVEVNPTHADLKEKSMSP